MLITKLFKKILVILLDMVIVELTKQTHTLLKKTKQKMREKNPRIYKVNNDIVVHHALAKTNEREDYELTNTD